MGGSSQSRPSQVRPSRMTCVCSSVERALSVSSMRSRNFPPSRRAKSQLKSAVLAPPTCRYPVGDGAKRTLIVTENGGGGIRTPDRVLKPYNGLANRRLQPLGHPSPGVNYPRGRPTEQGRFDRSTKQNGRRLGPAVGLGACVSESFQGITPSARATLIRPFP